MKLFVGLGNPGTEYARHRHNVGFMAVDRIAERHRLGAWKKRFHGYACDGILAGHRVLLLKPQSYMNDSGRVVGEAQRFLKIPEADVLVFHDELDLAPGNIRVKAGGGNAGHNGLRSITAHIGNEYGRVRIGIGHPGSKHLVHNYVLHDFAKADAVWLEPLLDAIADAAPRLAKGDEARFLTDVARALKDADPSEKVSTQPVEPQPRRAPPPPVHPAGERQAKRSSALAASLKKWLKGRKQET
jgi:PTH1 family peptidyl-tRNA hydrolase